MSLGVDLKYIRLVSPKLERFSQKRDYLFNCRCPLCGDSKKHTNKARGYFYRKVNDFFYNCKNCGVSTTLANFLKMVAPSLYQEYILERWKNGENGRSNYKKPEFKFDTPKFDLKPKQHSFKNAVPLTSLTDGHFCRSYVESRKIPTKFYDLLLYTDNYLALLDEVYPEHGKKLVPDQRLVIPYYDQNNELIGMTGRALTTGDTKLRYVAVRIASEGRLTFGLDRIDRTKKIYIVEGPLDSLFINNCLAAGDSALIQAAEEFDGCDVVLVFDNQPRNKDICKLIQRAIRGGLAVCIWPSYIEQKDINDMIMEGYTQDLLQRIIDTNTFSGVMADLHFTQWKRI